MRPKNFKTIFVKLSSFYNVMKHKFSLKVHNLTQITAIIEFCRLHQLDFVYVWLMVLELDLY